MSSVDKIASERSYKNRDEIIVSPEKMGPLYEEKVKMFFNEHLHEDEEIRYILDGNGFFDVRDSSDEWVRIRVEKDDLIILPSGRNSPSLCDMVNDESAGSALIRRCPRHLPSLHHGQQERMFKEAQLWKGDTNYTSSTSKPCDCSRTSRSGHLSTAPPS